MARAPSPRTSSPRPGNGPPRSRICRLTRSIPRRQSIGRSFPERRQMAFDASSPGGAAMSERPQVIRFANVEQIFGRDDGSAVTALDDVTFDIGRHEFLAVLGPSGCGKSTLLRLIAGLIFPTG